MRPSVEFPMARFGVGMRWFLLAGLLAAAPAAATGQIQPEWNRVQSIEPGRRVAVRLYPDAPQKGLRSVRGRFQSANLNSVTVLAASGSTVTVPQTSVRRVEVRRPLLNRPGAWALTALITIPLNILAVLAQDVREDTPSALARSIPLSVGLT